MNQREAALMSALDQVLAALTVLGDAVGVVITALNTPEDWPDEVLPGDFLALAREQCTTCGRPAYPHPYRHAVAIQFRRPGPPTNAS